MRSVNVALAALLALPLFASAQASPGAEGTYVIRGGTVVTGTGEKLANTSILIRNGRIAQVGTPAEIYEFPQSRFVADFVGTTNLFEGTVATCEPGLTAVTCRETGCDLLVDDVGRFTPGQRVWIALRPEKIRLSEGSAATPSGRCRPSGFGMYTLLDGCAR